MLRLTRRCSKYGSKRFSIHYKNIIIIIINKIYVDDNYVLIEDATECQR